MKYLRRHAQIVWLILYCMFGCAAAAAAHDCSGPDDCGVIPPNVDIATGIGAVGAGGVIGWSIVRRRNQKPETPCQELRKEVEDGAARIKDLEGKTAAAQADLERATKAAEQNPDFGKELPPGGPKWIA
jgi:hypothetical protein